MIDSQIENMLRLWGRWASVRHQEPRSRAYSAEGRWDAPSDMEGPAAAPQFPWTPDRMRSAEFTERVILTMHRQEIGALCVQYAGMHIRDARRIYAVRDRGFDELLKRARLQASFRLREALRFDNVSAPAEVHRQRDPIANREGCAPKKFESLAS